MEEKSWPQPRRGGATIEVRLLASDKPAMVETTPPKRRESLLAGVCFWWKTKRRCWIWNAMFWPAREPRLRLPRAQRTCSNGSARAFDVAVMNGGMAGGCNVKEIYEWIAATVRSGERAAADFLLVTTRRPVPSYRSMACLRWPSRLRWRPDRAGARAEPERREDSKTPTTQKRRAKTRRLQRARSIGASRFWSLNQCRQKHKPQVHRVHGEKTGT